jgi:hypothetical protein
MAWRRRTNEHNVDLNRNCLRPGEPYAGAPDAYRAVDGFLNPGGDRPPGAFLPRIGLLIARFGIAALKQRIAQGQYDFPLGLFFGGRALEEAPRRLLALMQERLGEAAELFGVDVHTGLGRFGRDTLLVDARADPAAIAALRARFGARVALLDPHESVAYTPRGLYDTLFEIAAPRATRIYVGQEFGTYSALRMLKILRRENWEFHHRAGGVSARTRLAIQTAFVPADREWRAGVVRRGIEVIERLRAG